MKIGGFDEMRGWLNVLMDEGMIELAMGSNSFQELNTQTADRNGGPSIMEMVITGMRLTPKGWNRIDSLSSGYNSKTAFIAMSFNKRTRAPIENAIVQACVDNNWEAFPIDKTHFLGGITDEIIAKINRSRFVVAEYTLHRRGVYYEAGYAEGRGLPVIPVVREDPLKKLHFDLQHLNFITWKDHEELRKKLSDKVGALIR